MKRRPAPFGAGLFYCTSGRWPLSTILAQQVRKPRQVMPPYSEKNLSGQDLADIYAYVVSIKPASAARDIPLLSTF